jgi:16S rRNA A1518/A1519 N6-dimethyltransferase RsmA/KsgA/DIM1 with predicted DNA glycosylase/AP lyase activity
MLLYFLLFLICAALLSFTFWMISHIYSILSGIPFVVSTDERTHTIIKLLNPKPGEKIVDLGSGDGKLLFEIAKYGSIVTGYEINPYAYYLSKIRSKKLGLKNVKIYRKNFFDADLSNF